MNVGELFVTLGVSADTAKITDFKKGLSEAIYESTAMIAALTGMSFYFQDMLTETLGTAFALQKFAMTTGLSREELQKWQIAGQMANVSAKTVAGSVMGLQQSLTLLKMTGQGAQPFMFLGINPNGNAFEVLNQLRDKLRNATAEMRPFIASQMEQMGVSKDMIPLLMADNQQWAEYAKQYKNAMSPESQKKALEMQMSLNKFKIELQAIWRDIIVNMIPILTELLGLVRDVLGVITPLLKTAIHMIEDIDKALKKVTGGFVGLKKLFEMFLIFKGGQMALGGAAGLIKMVMMLIGLPVPPHLLLILATLTAIFLVVQDIVGYFQGKKSITGVFVAEFAKALTNIKMLFYALPSQLALGMKNASKQIADIFRGIVNSIINACADALKSIIQLADKMIEKLKPLIDFLTHIADKIAAIFGRKKEEGGTPEEKGRRRAEEEMSPQEQKKKPWYKKFLRKDEPGVKEQKESGEAPEKQPPQKKPATKTPAVKPPVPLRGSEGVGMGTAYANEQKYDDLIVATAHKYGLDPNFLKAVIKQESGFKNKEVSKSGAMGLMQLMPFNAKGIDPFNPNQNVNRGAGMLAELIQKYHGDTNKALAAYNAGEGAVDKYGGIPPYAETQDYVSSINRHHRKYLSSQHPVGNWAGMGGTSDVGHQSLHGIADARAWHTPANSAKTNTYNTNIHVHSSADPHETARHTRREFNRQVEVAFSQKNNQGY
jgi:uncharacterized protein YeaO (DUF488 family)